MATNKLFIDANVLIDLVIERGDFFDRAKQVFEVVSRERINASISMITVSITSYYAEKEIGLTKSKEAFKKIRKICEVLPARVDDLDWALSANFPDIEDAIQNHIAESNGCTTIITRNTRDFKKSNLAVLTPKEFLATQEI